MPAKIIGMIGTQQEGIAVHLIKGEISRQWVIDFTRLHEQWNYDFVLVGYYASAAEGFAIALYAADHTERIKFLSRTGRARCRRRWRRVRSRPSTSSRRPDGAAYHRRHQRRGPGQRRRFPARERPLPPRRRVSRGDAEALDQRQPDQPPRRVLPRRGRLFRHQAVSEPLPPLFFGGSSEGALEMGARHCDVFAIFGEPLKETQERVQDFRRRAAAFGRSVGFNMSLRPIMAATEGAAWDKANALLADVERKTGAAPQPTNHSAERLLGYAASGDVHDERLWMGIARATGAPGNTSCLVGTPEQIAAAVLEYYRLGIHSFLLRGFENPHDTVAIGRDLTPLSSKARLRSTSRPKRPSRTSSEEFSETSRCRRNALEPKKKSHERNCMKAVVVDNYNSIDGISIKEMIRPAFPKAKFASRSAPQRSASSMD